MTQKRTSENDLVVTGNAAAATRRKSSRTRTKHSTAPAEASAVPALPATEAAEPALVLSEATPSVTNLAAPVAAVEPSRDAVARLAYFYWESRGCQGGSAEEDWLRAEMEIRNAATVTL